MERADRFNILSAGALGFGNIAGRGEGTGLVKVVNLFLRRTHFSIEILFLVEYDIYLFTARRVKTR